MNMLVKMCRDFRDLIAGGANPRISRQQMSHVSLKSEFGLEARVGGVLKSKRVVSVMVLRAHVGNGSYTLEAKCRGARQV